jgi:hypothetical protein
MKTKLLCPFGIAVAILFFTPITKIKAQTVTQTCSANIANGQNLTVNGDFAQGNTSFTYSTGGTGYNYFTCPTPMPNASCYSGPGQILVGAHSDWFNQGFNMGTAGFGNPITDHSPGNDNNMLMVDGTCTAGNDAWAQVIPVQQNTWYYFECWVTNLNVAPGSNGNASLNLNINNAAALVFSPPAATQGNWVHYSIAWFSGSNTSADLAIQNTTSTGCSTGVDFGLDDITFTPGCAYADVTTPQPLLGADGTLCGKGGLGINLNSNVAAASGRTFTWLQGTPGSIITGQTNPTYNATVAGTYTVCVQNSGGCLKSDVIVVSGTYSLSLPSTIVLCDPPSATLDPGFSGTGVTYKWESSTNGSTWTTIPGIVGTSSTYLANAPGYYRVTTVDPTCGTKTSNVTHITTQQTATPNNVSFCPPGKPTFSVTGTAGSTYQWYTNAAATSQVSPATTGTSYTPSSNIGSTGDPAGTQYTYYVKDITYYTETNVGASTLPASGNQQTQLSQYGTAFSANQPFIIDSMTVYWWLNNSNPTDPLTIQFQLTNDPPGTTTPTNISGGTSAVYSATNSTAKMTPAFGTSASGIYAVRVPVGITVAAAGTYRLSAVNANTTGNVQIQQSGTAYPYNDPVGVLSIYGTAQNGNPVGTTFYGDMYKWKIRYQLDCLPIPVVATKDCALPVHFINFIGQTNASSVSLFWATSTEKNSSHYIIEKSKDGIHFSSIGKADAAGQSTSIHNYSFTDNSLESGIVYYRLVEFDIDGTTTVSEIISVNSRLGDIIKIIPNPNNGNFEVNIEGAKNEVFQLALYNSLGETVYQASDKADESLYSKNIQIQTITPGIYFLHIQSGTKKWMEKIVKQ